MPLTYHAGQLEVQTEANTRPVAEMLREWVGPLGDFTLGADMIVLAAQAEGGFEFATLSGEAPLVEPAGGMSLQFPAPMFSPPAEGGTRQQAEGGTRLVGGIAISLAERRRARLNGEMTCDYEPIFTAHEGFTNCRKYIVPSLALDEAMHLGPQQKQDVPLDDPWLAGVIARCETSFLASSSPEGQPDVSHRGGPAGFLKLDAAAGRLSWDEYIGDGMLKSGGNVRACPELSLLVIDLDTGDAAQLNGRGVFTVTLREKRPRTDGLMQVRDPFPVQAQMAVELTSAQRLSALIRPRQKIDKVPRLTCADTTDEQAPQ
jgi:hypothetical protein